MPISGGGVKGEPRFEASGVGSSARSSVTGAPAPAWQLGFLSNALPARRSFWPLEGCHP